MLNPYAPAANERWAGACPSLDQSRWLKVAGVAALIFILCAAAFAVVATVIVVQEIEEGMAKAFSSPQFQAQLQSHVLLAIIILEVQRAWSWFSGLFDHPPPERLGEGAVCSTWQGVAPHTMN